MQKFFSLRTAIVLIIFLASSTTLFTAKERSKVGIVTINNQSERAARIGAYIIDAKNKKKLPSLLTIPFVTIKDNIQQFVLKDYTEIPRQAIIVCTRAGNFALWQNEGGICCCKVESRVRDQQAEILIKQEKLPSATTLKCLLLVAANGSLRVRLKA